MPEGPEVEISRLQLVPRLEGQRIEAVDVRLNLRKYFDQRQGQKLVGQQIARLERRGKRMAITTDEFRMTNGFGMSGGWRWLDISKKYRPDKHDVFRIQVEQGSAIYNDARHFGSAQILSIEEEWADDIGLDGLDRKAMLGKKAPKRIAQMFANTKKPIKPLLLDQSRIASIGNIYASEICFRLGLHPETPMNQFEDYQRLGEITYQVLQGALEGHGSRIRGPNPFSTPDHSPVNGFERQVYQRAGKKCRICRTRIVEIRQNSRATFFCPQCQS